VTNPSSLKHYAIKAYRGTKIQLQARLTLAKDGDEWFDSHPGRFTSRDSFHQRRLFGLWSLYGRFRDEETSCPYEEEKCDSSVNPHSRLYVRHNIKRTQQYTTRTRINGLDSTKSRHVLPLEHNNQYQPLKDPDPVSLNKEARQISVCVRGGESDTASAGRVGWPQR